MKFRLLLFCFVFFFCLNNNLAATLYSRSSTGFYTSGTWSTLGCGGASCFCTPTAADNIVICAGYTVTLSSGSILVGPGGNCASITIQSGGTLNMLGSGVLTVKNGGFLTIDAGGALSVNVFTNNNNSDGVTINGSLTLGGISPVFTNGTGADIVGSGTITIPGGSTFTNNGTIMGPIVLPIELLSFEAASNKTFIDLSWMTATEINNDYFTVERSSDGVHFAPLMVVDGAGNSTSILNYSVVDNDPIIGTSYYRLKQTDFNGAFSFSDVKTVEFDSDNFAFDFYPNPMEDGFINVVLSGNVGDKIQIEIYDAIGKKCYSKSIFIQTKGSTEDKLSTNSVLTSGFYMVTASLNGKSYQKKLIVK